jgi:hypothetical protein
MTRLNIRTTAEYTGNVSSASFVYSEHVGVYRQLPFGIKKTVLSNLIENKTLSETILLNFDTISSGRLPMPGWLMALFQGEF